MIVTRIIFDSITEAVGVLDLASKSRFFRRAIVKLQAGDINGATNEMLGAENESGFYGEILGKLGAKPALNFRNWWQNALVTAKSRAASDGVLGVR